MSEEYEYPERLPERQRERVTTKEYLIRATAVPTDYTVIKTDVLDTVNAESSEEAKNIFTALLADRDYIPEKIHFAFETDALVRAATIMSFHGKGKKK